jgi:long-chain acyl-CoA synthetase
MDLALTDDDLPLQRLYRWERERSNQVFLTQPYGGGQLREWTWAQAIGEVRRIAAHLQAQNWEPGSKVAILSKNCAWWIMADLAIWMAGHVTVPVYPSLRFQSVRHILEHSDAKACFVGATDNPDMPRLGVPAGVHRIGLPTGAEDEVITWDSLIRTVEPLTGFPTRAGDELATIFYTSGTTGVPKGVMHRFRALAFNAKSLIDRVKTSSKDRYISYLPLAHIVERIGVEVFSIALGCRIFFVENIDTFLNDVKRARPTLFLAVPRLLVKFQQRVFQKIPREKLEKRLRVPILGGIVRRKVLDAMGLGSVQLAACGAAPLAVDVLLWYRGLGLKLAEGYGMTETLVTHLPNPVIVRPGYVGPPVLGVEQRVSAEGELLIRSPMNMIGYYKNPDASRQCFDADGFFHTGDIVALDPDGQIRIVGRAKEQFKTSKGKYVAPAPIETRLSEHPDVEACCLMGAGYPSPFALVLLTPEARSRCAESDARTSVEASLEKQLQEVNAELDPYERVAFLAIVDGPWSIENGLITPTLKIRRSSLESLYAESVDKWRNQNRQVVWESAAHPVEAAQPLDR